MSTPATTVQEVYTAAARLAKQYPKHADGRTRARSSFVKTQLLKSFSNLTAAAASTYAEAVTHKPRPTLAEVVTTGGMWEHPVKILHALCPDGKRRTVRLNQAPDTYFSWSGRATINGKTVTGFTTLTEDSREEGAPQDYQFTPNIKPATATE